MSSEGTSRKFLYTAVCTGNLVALVAGISLGWTPPVSPKLNDLKNFSENPLGKVISKEEESWIGSLLAVGAVLGPLIAGYAADKIGRKITLILCGGVSSLLAYLLLAFGDNIAFYYVGRFCAGFSVGSVFTVLPNFNSEIAEDSIRGAVSSSMNIFVVSGILFAYAVGPYISIMLFSILCAIIPAIFIVTFFLFVPESPYYLLARNNTLGAMESLKKFRSTNDIGVKRELEIMKATVQEALSNKGSFWDIFSSKGLIKALIISLSLAGFQQLSGINIVFFYTQNIFEATGSSIPSDISPIIVGSVQLAASFVTPLLVDRLGRKLLFLISAIGMLISELPLGLYFYLKDDGSNVTSIYWLPVLCLVIYIIAYNFGFGPLPWTVMAEVFPPNLKGPSSTATASFCWLLGFIITKFFSNVSYVIGMAGSFWLFSGFCLLAAVFVLTYMIETKGKSFQQIQDILSN